MRSVAVGGRAIAAVRVGAGKSGESGVGGDVGGEEEETCADRGVVQDGGGGVEGGGCL